MAKHSITNVWLAAGDTTQLRIVQEGEDMPLATILVDSTAVPHLRKTLWYWNAGIGRAYAIIIGEAMQTIFQTKEPRLDLARVIARWFGEGREISRVYSKDKYDLRFAKLRVTYVDAPEDPVQNDLIARAKTRLLQVKIARNLINENPDYFTDAFLAQAEQEVKNAQQFLEKVSNG